MDQAGIFREAKMSLSFQSITSKDFHQVTGEFPTSSWRNPLRKHDPRCLPWPWHPDGRHGVHHVPAVSCLASQAVRDTSDPSGKPWENAGFMGFFMVFNPLENVDISMEQHHF